MPIDEKNIFPQVGVDGGKGLAPTDAAVFDHDGSKGFLKKTSIPYEVAIPLLTTEFSRAADAVGITEAPERYLLSNELTQFAQAAFFEISYLWAATADGSIELFDVTSATVIASFSFIGGESSERRRSADILSALVAGHEIKPRINVTVAGGAGETARLRAAKLIVRYRMTD